MKDVDFITTLSGYVHWKLTGKKVISVGDASGMFPIDSETKTYHAGMMENLTLWWPETVTAGDWERFCLRFWWPDSRPALDGGRREASGSYRKA
mgnify:CR=1 FL=1